MYGIRISPMLFSNIAVLAITFLGHGLRDTMDSKLKARNAFVPRSPHRLNSARYAFSLAHPLRHLKYGLNFDSYARRQLSKSHCTARVKTVSIFAKYFVVKV